MAQIIHPNFSDPSQYYGLEWIFEYTNPDGKLTTWNCGQAAAATFLTHHGLMDSLQAARNMELLEAGHPPDQMAGYCGTGRRRVERILHAFKLDFLEIAGEAGLKRQLAAHNPVLVMLGQSSGQWLGYNLPGGHWMVAYGYDAECVYLTNWGAMPWETFRADWNRWTTRWIRMNGCGLARTRP